MASMDMNGMNFTGTGALMDMEEMIEMRKKKGQCITCGWQTHTKKMFKLHAITVPGEVLDGRCLRCNPLEVAGGSNRSLVASSRRLVHSSSRNVTVQGSSQHHGSSKSSRYRGDSQRRITGGNHDHGGNYSGAGVASSRLSSGYSHSNTRNPSVGQNYNHSTTGHQPVEGSVDERTARGGSGGSPYSGERAVSNSGNLRRLSRGDNSVNSASVSSGIGNTSTPSTADLGKQRLYNSYRSLDRGGELYGEDYPTPQKSISYEEYYGDDTSDGCCGGRIGRSGPFAKYRESRVEASSPSPTSSRRSPSTFTECSPNRTMGEGKRGGYDRDAGSYGSRGLYDDQDEKLFASSSAAPPQSIFETNRPSLDKEMSRTSLRSCSSDLSAHSQFSDRERERSERETQSLHVEGCDRKQRRSSTSSLGRICSPSPSRVLKDESNYESSSLRDWASCKRSSSPYRKDARVDDHYGRNLTSSASFDDNWKKHHARQNSYRKMSSAPTSPQESGQYDDIQAQQPTNEGELEGVRQSIQRCSSPADIILFMIANFSVPYILIEACRQLASLDASDAECNSLLREDGYLAILDTMRNFSKNASVQEASCSALSAFSVHHAQHMDIVKGEGVDCIVSAMRAFPENTQLQERAVAVLANLSLSENIHFIILDAGAVDAIVKAMTAHSLNAVVQERASVALANLAARDCSVRDTITIAGGIDAICVSMVMHPTDPKVQENGCTALRNLCSNDDENKVATERAGGIDAVIGAMQIHRGDVGVQREGCYVLSNLAVNAGNKVVIGQSNGIDVIVRAMWVHSEDADLQELACRALWTLSVEQENKSLIAQVGGIAAIVSAMQGHIDVPAVQEKGCGCLANLAANSDDNKRFIVEGEGIDAIVMAMVLHPEERAVQERACNALRKLAFEPHLNALRAAGVATLLEAAAIRFPANCKEKAEQVLGIL